MHGMSKQQEKQSKCKSELPIINCVSILSLGQHMLAPSGVQCMRNNLRSLRLAVINRPDRSPSQ